MSKITLWIENVSHYFSLYHEKPSICNLCVKFHDNRLSITEILLFRKTWSKIAVANIANINTCVMLTYARQYWRQRTVRQRLRNFCINKNKIVT